MFRFDMYKDKKKERTMWILANIMLICTLMTAYLRYSPERKSKEYYNSGIQDIKKDRQYNAINNFQKSCKYGKQESCVELDKLLKQKILLNTTCKEGNQTACEALMAYQKPKK